MAMIDIAEATGGGGLYPWPSTKRGPVEAFGKKKSKLNTKSPRGWGVLISTTFDAGTGRTLIQGFFFWAVRFDSIKRNLRNQKPNPFNGRRRADASNRRFIFRRAGGGQKSARSAGRT